RHLEAGYPNVAVESVLRKMHAKVVTGAVPQPTAAEYPRAITGWLDHERPPLPAAANDEHRGRTRPSAEDRTAAAAATLRSEQHAKPDSELGEKRPVLELVSAIASAKEIYDPDKPRDASGEWRAKRSAASEFRAGRARWAERRQLLLRLKAARERDPQLRL